MDEDVEHIKTGTESLLLVIQSLYYLIIKSEFDHYRVMVGGLDAVHGLLDHLVADHAHMLGVNKAKVYC